MKMNLRRYPLPQFLCLLLLLIACKKSSSGGDGPTPPPTNPPVTPVTGATIQNWMTKGDKSSLLARQTDLVFSNTANSNLNVEVDSTTKFQTVDGFGYTLTQGSAYVINQLPAATRSALLTELFGSADNSISVNYLRIGIGATDLSSTVYSYDDLPTGNTDVSMASFSLAPDMADLVPLLKDILLINPSIKILATPWSAPIWMKDNGSSIGGNLNPAYYGAYATYFVKYIQAMQAQGIHIDAITPQNEPLNPANNPSMSLYSGQESSFIKNNLGPAFGAAGISTKIIIYDHNLDVTSYPLDILADPNVRPYIDGSAFHLYAGDVSAMSTMHDAYPSKNVYFTGTIHGFYRDVCGRSSLACCQRGGRLHA